MISFILVVEKLAAYKKSLSTAEPPACMPMHSDIIGRVILEESIDNKCLISKQNTCTEIHSLISADFALVVVF